MIGDICEIITYCCCSKVVATVNKLGEFWVPKYREKTIVA